MKRWSAALVLCLALGLVAAGCGSDDKSDSKSADKAQEPTGGAPAAGGGAGKVISVRMKNTQFLPMSIKVKVGGTVKWTNNDSFPHTVTKKSGPGSKFDSGDVDGGGTFTQKFAKAGKIDYVCEIHPGQTGTITVE